MATDGGDDCVVEEEADMLHEIVTRAAASAQRWLLVQPDVKEQETTEAGVNSIQTAATDVCRLGQ